MHELSIAQSVAETARRALRVRPGCLPKRIGLRIGSLSGVLPQSLEFCFESITKSTDLDGCRMVIEYLQVLAECSSCGHVFEVDHFRFICPECGSGGVKVTQGYELEVAYLEVDEPPTAAEFSTNGLQNVNENHA